MKLFGLKLGRYIEWFAVVRSEGRKIGIVRTARSLAVAGFKGLGRGLGRPGASPCVSRQVWRARMRACTGCPVYNRGRHACRDTAGLGLGCGCAMIFKAMLPGPQCWRRSIGDAGGHAE